jgi:CheY-like chemotaxis protein
MAARILIIEDDMASRELANYLLSCAGHVVRTARNGAEGLGALQAELPDLVICDLQMPVMNGFEFLAHLRAAPARGAINVVAVTAFSMTGDRDKALAAGFDGYFSKPIDPHTFVASMEALLPENLREGAAPAAPGEKAGGQ